MADPLAILGGFAAGMQLVDVTATALLKTIGFLRDLRDVPKKMALTLDDVEKSTARIHHICGAMLQPDSKVFEKLDIGQFGNLGKIATELRQAMDEVNTTLKSFVGSESSGNAKTVLRIWRAIMSVKAEKDVMEKLERIDRLNNELNRQLAVTSVELHATVIDKLDTAETSNRNLHVTILEQHTSATTQLEATTSIVQNVENAVTDVRDNVGAMNAHVSRMAKDMMFIRDRLSTLCYDQGRETISPQQLQDFISQQVKETQANIIRQLSDEILTVSTGARPGLSLQSQNICSSLTEADRRAVEQHTRVQLLRYPRSLAEASTRLDSWKRAKPRQCRCRSLHKVHSTRFGPVALRSDEYSDHHPDCPCAKSGHRYWSYSAKAALTPFLNATLELAVGAKTGPGFWCIVPPLRFYGTVRRSASPLFQAFDRLPMLCAKPINSAYFRRPSKEFVHPYENYLFENTPPSFWEGVDGHHSFDISSHLHFYVEWDIVSTKRQLEELCIHIRYQIDHGLASGAHSDESGQTILFAFVKLVILLSSQWRQFASQLESLLTTILDSGVDLAAQAIIPDRIWGWSPKGFSPVTAPEFLFRIFDTHRSVVDILGDTSSILSQLFWQAASHGVSMSSICEHAWDRPGLPFFLQRYPEFAEVLGFHPLELAVLDRSLPTVERLVAAKDASINQIQQSRAPLQLTELAIGWAPGLRHLVLAGYPVTFAIGRACDLRDSRSLSILLETPRPIFSEDPEYTEESVLGIAIRGPSLASTRSYSMIRLVLGELVRRRNALRNLALKTLRSKQLKELRLDEEAMLDANAEPTYRLLTEVTAVDESLDCWVSPYHEIYPEDLRLGGVGLLDVLYDAGFQAVDIPDGQGKTPLYRILGLGFWLFPFVDLCHWFVSRGARAEIVARDDRVVRWPTVLFYLAAGTRLPERELPIPISDGFLASLPHTLHRVSDSCVCSCGAGGCLPVHTLWRCTPSLPFCCKFIYGRTNMTDAHRLLRGWIETWKLRDGDKDLMYAEVARLELFERLGMAHTCCVHDDWDVEMDERIGSCDDVEKARLRDEDSELARQLDDLMAAYETARATYGGSIESFWRLWWQVVAEILPPLLAVEACRNRLMDELERGTEEFRELDRSTIENRSAREKEALEKAGYVGSEFEDFREVIRVHFSGKDWNNPESNVNDTDSERWGMDPSSDEE